MSVHIASCKACQQDSSATDAAAVSSLMNMFTDASVQTQGAMVSALLDRMHPAQLRCLGAKLALAARVDYIKRLSPEISLRILNYLDARSLCRAAQVSFTWRLLADDDLIWHRMCEQHIDKKCKTCGWGLPIIRSGGGARRGTSNPPTSNQPNTQSETLDSSNEANPESLKRKRMESDASASDVSSSTTSTQVAPVKKRSWKSIYAERLVVEQNWRKPKYEETSVHAHRDGVACMQYNDCKARFVTGGHDHVVRYWDADSNTCLKELTGHTQCVTGVQFDEHKIVSCSLDRTIRIWSISRNFECLRTLEGHRDGVVCLHYVDELLASGSADASIRVWNILSGQFYTLRGHTDWVNKVVIYQKTQLFSCSDDRTVRLWNLETRQVLRQFTGHQDHVQSLSISLPHMRAARASIESKGGAPKLVTASADKTVKVWDISTGACLNTLFGYESSVMCVASDTLRIVSGTADNRILVFDVESGRLMHSMGVDRMGGGNGAIQCCVLSDTRIMTGGDDGVVRSYNFYPPNLLV
ncbi:hypothetical protein HDU81_003902 [Chytriomyces hyalinus]|nr:hypothetical protein HDU81_003902 [Chytriomyces hyalinus]